LQKDVTRVIPGNSLKFLLSCARGRLPDKALWATVGCQPGDRLAIEVVCAWMAIPRRDAEGRYAIDSR
jgi:hypothetical protein